MRPIPAAAHGSFLAFVAFTLSSACAPPARSGGEGAAGPALTVVDARARVLPGGDRGVLHLAVRNDGGRPDRLVAIETPVATAELHETVDEDGVLHMAHRADGFQVPAGGVLELGPGGKHVMLLGLTAATGTFPVELRFRDAGRIEIEVELTPFSEVDS